MIKVPSDQIRELEKVYPGIIRLIGYFETLQLPPCPFCSSPDTALVMVGCVGRSINIAAATTKATLIANGPKPGKRFCNTSRRYAESGATRDNAGVKYRTSTMERRSRSGCGM